MPEVSFSSDQRKALSLISIVVPAYNEDGVILEFNRRLSLVRQDLSLASQMIFVNGCLYPVDCRSLPRRGRVVTRASTRRASNHPDVLGRIILLTGPIPAITCVILLVLVVRRTMLCQGADSIAVPPLVPVFTGDDGR